MQSTRRGVLAAAWGGALAGTLGTMPQAMAQPAAPQLRGIPIRIGCISALTGAQEVLGRPILNGALIAADQLNAAGGVLGRPIEIVPADAHADPAAAVAWTKSLAKDGINLLCGCVTSDLALAVSTVLQPAGSIMVTCSAQTDRLTHEAFVPNMFRVTDNAYMRNRAQARLIGKRYPGIRRWAAILPETEYGRSAWAAFHDGLMEAASPGQQPIVTTPVMTRFGATDYRAAIAALQRLEPDALFIAVYGDDGIEFYQQAQEAGLLHSVQALADPINEFLVPQTLGGATPEHLWLASSWYYGGYQSLPMGRQLYQEHLRRTGIGMPLGFVNAGHSAILAYAAAIVQSGQTDTASVIAALPGLTFDTAKGPVRFRPEDHQAVCDVNFLRIKPAIAPLAMEINDTGRPDVEVAEFIRLSGADVIEPPSPGRPLAYAFPS